MLQAIITSNLVDNPHRLVKLQYFENLTRYFKFFQTYPLFIETAIVSVKVDCDFFRFLKEKYV
jgi:aromatic ring hydroxylase